MNVYVGVSGFSYPGWVGRFYPKGTKSEEFLGYYSKVLGSVEVNSSFYAPPSQAMVKSWSARTSEGFRFAFKAPKSITHVAKLGEGAAESAARFSKTIGGLGPRAGPVLFQLPPYTKQDLKLLEEFLVATAGDGDRIFEFRHASWLAPSTYKLLERHGAGSCIAETEDMGPVFQTTGGLAYFRLRKDAYDAKIIAEWGKRIAKVAKGLPGTYVYLRHDETGENALLAQSLAARLAGA